MKQKQSTVTAVQAEHVDSAAGLVTLAELAAEGLGTVDVLARQLADRIVVDDIGRRAVSRAVARGLLAARAEAEERQRETRRRRAEEWAKRPRPVRGGVPALPGLTALETMLANPDEDEARKDEAAEKTAALLRGELVGGRFSPRGQ